MVEENRFQLGMPRQYVYQLGAAIAAMSDNAYSGHLCIYSLL